ncbi:MAG: hypothetical protein U5N10_15025 [Gemmobacter sp.]|nr:hypothetical protein [Gemmobacter sp.]
MAISAAEQYAIELVNRARLNPVAEAKRFGIGLNDGIAAGTISNAAKQVLAPHQALDGATESHGQWILDTDTFSHTGVGGSRAGDRIEWAGYPSFGGGSGWGENLSLMSYAGMSEAQIIEAHHAQLMRSSSHRPELMEEQHREIGIGVVSGYYQSYDVSVEVQNFAYRPTVAYVTGVAYGDSNRDKFYSLGEGQSGVTMALLGGSSTVTTEAGGYALEGIAGTEVGLTITANGQETRLGVDLTDGNVKVDVVNGNLLKVSGDVTLWGGAIRNVTALGVGDIDLTGSGAANTLTGNSGKNVLIGGGGNDVLAGLGGHDRLLGGNGNDRLMGGNAGDTLVGGAGGDTLIGGGGYDRLTGGGGPDTFVFSNGFARDRITDFNAGQGDKLQFDDNLWSGGKSAQDVVNSFAQITGDGVVFDFGGNDRVTLVGVTSLDGLADHIAII